MRYMPVRESDGTYTIRQSRSGLNYNEIVKTGVRGCNVERVLSRLIAQEFYRSLGHVPPQVKG